jgi:two-component system phosphate regulon sensor histidine kinase PhoR
MSDNIVASVPFGWVVASALLLGLLCTLVGWQLPLWARRRKFANERVEIFKRAVMLLNSLPQGALLADEHGRILAQNSSAGKTLTEINSPDGLPLSLTIVLMKVVLSDLPEIIEIPVPSAPGRRVQALITPLATAENRISALVIFTGPLSNHKRSENTQRLSRTLAHELRTPLTAILGHIEILNSCRFDEEALWRRSLGFISSETERLARLVEDMLYLSRLERAPLDLQPVNLRRVAEEAISTLYDEAEKSQVSLVLRASNDLPLVTADPDRLRQVFTNLLDNAIKYAPGSTVTVSLTSKDGLARVEVHDSGPGISAQDLEHLFEPFYRSEGTSARERGTGLGLTIVQTILEQHHAPFQVDSSPGDGASFSFSLPVEIINSAPAS